MIGMTSPFSGVMLGALVNKLDDVDLEDTAESMESIAKSYWLIAQSSKEMEVEALKESTRMFNALAYLSEQGGEDAIEALGDELIEAVKQLALMIADFGGSVENARDENKSAADKIKEGYNKVKGLVTGNKGGSGGSGGTGTTNPTSGSSGGGNNDDVVHELQRMNSMLEDILG